MINTRRTFLKRAGGLAFGAAALPLLDLSRADDIREASKKLSNTSPEAAARDEDFWSHIQKAYRLSPKFINLESGYFSPQPYSGVEALCKNFRTINEIPSFYMRRMQGQERKDVTQLLARFAGCSPDEILITRNTTESLNNVIMGLDLKKGDEALWGSFEYPSMKQAFVQRAAREGIVNNIIEIPLVSTNNQDMVRIYRESITPKTKVILVSHMTYLSGQVLPVREICDMAHERGVEVIVDAAHSWTHLNYKIPDLKCDYYGASMHKWMGSPLGTGILYIRKDKIKKIWPLFGDSNYESDNINKLGHIGTRPCAIELTIADAIKFNNSIGIERKEARLRYLKNYWAEKVA
ncbi:MAG: aminotransferase class V-fold PLP-dependent enzyme, partial [bacterium]|nr:aminotransferase class V-fold PLP-dependent enzyme [bacterium]